MLYDDLEGLEVEGEGGPPGREYTHTHTHIHIYIYACG